MRLITVKEIDIVNRSAWAVLAEMHKMIEEFGLPGQGVTYFLRDAPGYGHKSIWMEGLSELVELRVQSEMPAIQAIYGNGVLMPGITLMFTRTIELTVMAILHRTGGRFSSPEIALECEMTVFDAFCRWDVFDHMTF